MDELDEIRAKLRSEILSTHANASRVTVLSEGDLDAFVASHPLVLVDVWAPWCGPCRHMSPLVEELAREWGPRVAVAKINSDDAPGVVGRYRIQGIPTFLWFQDGAFVGQQVGAQPKTAFQNVLDELVSPS